MEEAKKKLEDSFERLQDLDIKSTLTNMEKLLKTLYDLQDVYAKLGGEEDGGHTPDSGERYGH